MPPFSPQPKSRLLQIDQLRGLVMLLMLLDHVRETFYLHLQVSDPVDVADVSPLLFGFRLLAHLCAPVFVFLTGLSAWLYGQRQPDPRKAAAAFLFKRGLFLVVLELTLVNFAWTFAFPPDTVYLQVIWAIGLSMLSLSALLWLPRGWLVVVGVVLVAGHNLLDGMRFEGEPWRALWAIAHQREWLAPFGEGIRFRTSYPVLPWIGVIALGHAMAPWFAPGFDAERRQRLLLVCGTGALVLFAVLRGLDVYGDAPWQAGDNLLRSAMAMLNVTKYPPSLLFLCLTLGVGLLLLRAFERCNARWLAPLAVLGAAPMFFYLLHLYVLKLLYLAAEAAWGRTQGTVFGLEAIAWMPLITLLLAVALYPAVRWFAALKTRRRDWAWLRYL